ncbi:MAG: DUF4234 domain-containing protein [Arcobacteraceae bacterium]|nr:DUF4234 domain-containing protein [Arcobacteraceae bacterium]
MIEYTLIKELKTESTWKLFFLSAITLGIYNAHYIRKQSKKINNHIGNDNKLSERLITTLIFFIYASVISILFNIFFPNIIIDNFATFFSNISWILTIIWGYKARNRLNNYLNFDKSNPYWFHGFWTFLFTPLYFNYNINCFYQKIYDPEKTDNTSEYMTMPVK